jgi:hypothetical protein
MVECGVAIVGMPSRSSMLSLGTQERLLLLFMQDQNSSMYLQLYFISVSCFALGFLWADQTNRWRSPDNVWKKEPFLVTALPTIIKLTADGVSIKVEISKFEELIIF